MNSVTRILPEWWQRRVAAAGVGVLVGLAVAIGANGLPALLAIIGLAIGLVSGSLLLAWAADVAEVALRGRFVLIAVALAGVLPELTVEVQLAYGQQPQFVTANLTGATRLLLAAAVALPAFGRAPLTTRPRTQQVLAGPGRRLDLAVLAAAAVAGVTVIATGELTLVHGVVFASLYVLYLSKSGASTEPSSPVAGVPAGIAALGATTARRLCCAMFVAATAGVILTARPFPGEMVRGGAAFGVDPYLLIQYVIPLATETPELVVAGAFVLNRRPDRAVALLLVAAVTQWTVALAAVSGAYLVGGGGIMLPLSGRERVELLLTTSTTLMTTAALISLRLERIDAWIVTFAYGLQAVFTGPQARLIIGVALTIFATAVLIDRRRFLLVTLAALEPRSNRQVPQNPG